MTIFKGVDIYDCEPFEDESSKQCLNYIFFHSLKKGIIYLF